MTTDTRETTFPDGAPFLNEGRLLKAVEAYLEPEDVTAVADVLRFLHEVSERGAWATGSGAAGEAEDERDELEQALAEAVSTAQTLAESLRIDAVTLVAVLIYPLLDNSAITLADVRARVGEAFGAQVAHTIESLERFESTQRSGAALRRTALAGGDGAEADRERRRSRERRKRQDADGLRRMFLSVAEDPRVVIIKIAEQLRLMRAVRKAADRWRANAGLPTSQSGRIEDSGPQVAPFAPPAWTLEECVMLAEETREVYAPLAARLGMGRVEGELEDVAFAVLEPEEYRWLSEAVAEETEERRSYVERVCATLREEMRAIGIAAEVSGRVKHLYSIYRKVKRSGSRDLTGMFDILAFRIIVNSVAECYQALGHVHELWRPTDGRIKDFIAAPKPNGYQSLHTTVFLGDRLAEIQIRTHEMHQLAEYGVAMHWYYKDVGDTATAKARPLQAWMQQVQEWQQELRSPGTAGAQRALEAVKGDVLKEQIFVFTPAGDVKELPAGSTPLDFAYRIHSELGNHVAGARVTSDDGAGRLVKRMVPLDYELHGGDVVDIIRRNDAHPTRDWLRFARTKAARQHITRYLKEHERDIDLQIGRERLDRELRILGLRKGVEDITDDDLRWLAAEFNQPNPDGLLVALARDSVRMSALLTKVRERLKLPTPAEQAIEALESPVAPREEESGASVAGLSGLMTRLGACCNPLPGDEIVGFVTRGRGVVIHRATCPNLRTLAEREPERVIAVAWPRTEETVGAQKLRAHIVVEGADRTGLLRDVSGVITNRKINMVKVETVTKKRPNTAVIDAVLEIQRPEDLEEVLRELRDIAGVTLAERKEPNARKREPREKREKPRR
jgi:GTP diphosphokinase / guanosine-3',5'-bis(diphosphate) 3'-diphosphatase